ncbi:site-specific recombinase XerD [Candidatus Nitrososphaera evergladensis SR1]|uniref:Site-specific recombinase XerD n=1 Tax=Candidatus Nitrososphaera evergladensis SR1 TaxID=1459636 RepID=A0A075MUY4_9ARCH|nr:site-specific integrase [Candidatus Nitrososphaera evergladensis]AIF85030.1 site-specific recombinase XerD [Candidatus Nitrososphaera evergladensis SR1]
MSNKRTFPEYEDATAWKNFVNTIKSKETAAHYKLNLVRFLTFAKVNCSLDEFVNLDRKRLEKLIVDFIMHRQDEEKVRAQTVAVELSCIKHFFVYNDRPDINWKIIRGYLHEAIKAVKDKAYTTEEIQKMLTYADLRTKCVILLMASSGMRVGAITNLRMKDLHEIPQYGIYAITPYANTRDEYVTYCSPECKAAIDAYLHFRKLRGENINPNSPLIRERFDFNNPAKTHDARPIHRDTLAHLTNACAISAGLRVKTDKQNRDRKDNMLNHAFRKFFFKACGRAQINPIVRELLMGHKVGNQQTGVTRLMMVYDATEENELLREYLRVIEHVTITDENRAKMQLKEKEERTKQLEVEFQQFKTAMSQLHEQGLITL